MGCSIERIEQHRYPGPRSKGETHGGKTQMKKKKKAKKKKKKR
jgi:hypothetical protein